MSPKQSSARLAIYIALAMMTSAISTLTTKDFSTAKTQEIVVFVLSVATSGLVTARSYIDTSESQVIKP